MDDRGDMERLSEAVGGKARRKLAAQGRRDDVWSWLGRFGLVGWSVAVPTLAGLLAGWWLDGRFPQRFSWTVTLLVAGLALGCLNAWLWVRRESSDD